MCILRKIYEILTTQYEVNKVDGEVYCLFFNVLFTKYIDIKSEGSQKKEELEKYSNIWAHSSDG